MRCGWLFFFLRKRPTSTASFQSDLGKSEGIIFNAGRCHVLIASADCCCRKFVVAGSGLAATVDESSDSEHSAAA